MITVAVIAGLAAFACLCWANGKGAVICAALGAMALGIKYLP